MKSVLSLIGNPAAPPILDEAVRHALAHLTQNGIAHGAPTILAPGIAAEIPVETPDAPTIRSALSAVPVDVNILLAQNRRKKFLIADMDSTVITCECLDEIADFVGLKPKVAAITERAMRGELAFEPALRERVALLNGVPAQTLEQVYKERVKLTAGARMLVQTMRANGAYTVLVSGGFTFFTGRVAAAAGFHEDRANQLGIAGGTLSGTVIEPILGREAKLTALLETARRHRAAPEDALAVGDGANDLAMIQAAGLGVAFHAKPVVAEAAGARIDRGDLTALLYLQGYSAADFVTS